MKTSSWLRMAGAALFSAIALPACAQSDDVISNIPVEPFASSGAAVSLTVGEVTDRLHQLGFTGDRCVYQRAVPDRAQSDVLRLDADRACRDDALVTRLSFVGHHVGAYYGASDASDLMQRMIRSLAANGTCVRMEDSNASCTWNAPESSPLIHSLYAYVTFDRVTVEMTSWPSHERPTGRFALQGPDPFEDLDPAAPLGVRTGMTLGELDARLVELGFESTFDQARPRCRWIIDRPADSRIEINSGAPAQCDRDRPIEKLGIHHTEQRLDRIEAAPDQVAMRAKFIGVLGPPSDGQVCPDSLDGLNSRLMICEWNDPQAGGFPHAQFRYMPADLDKSGPRSTFEYRIDYPDSDWRRPTTRSPSAAERAAANRRAVEERQAADAAAKREACGERDTSKVVDERYTQCVLAMPPN